MSVLERIKTPMGKFYKKHLALCIVGVLFIGLGTSCGADGTNAAGTDIQSFIVDVQNPAVESIYTSDELIGTVEARNSAVIYPMISGEVLEVRVQPGDYVSAGQILCVIDNVNQTMAKPGVDAAQLGYNDAKTNLERMTTLYQEGAVSKQAYDSAVTAYNAAAVQLQSAQITYGTQADFSQITSPINGVVESISVQVHGMASPQMAVCTVTDGAEKDVVFSVTESVQQKISVGKEIVLVKNSQEYHAAVTEVNTIADPMTGLFKIKAQVEEGTGLSSNTSVKVVLISDESNGELVVPLSSVYYDAGEPFVYVYEQGTAVRKDVTTGSSNEDKIEILSGVNADDLVITTWSSLLRDGAQVSLGEEE